MKKNKNLIIIGAVVIAAIIAALGIYIKSNKYEFKPKTESNLFTLGQIAAGKGEHEKAIGYYQELLQKDPKHAIAIRFMTDSYLKTGQNEKALENIDKMVTLDPTTDNIEYAISVSLQLKNKEKAEQFIKLLKNKSTEATAEK